MTVNRTSDFKVGDKCKVFDNLSWSKTGDIGNNGCFYVNATVLNFNREHFDITVDVLMENGRISKRHFISGVKK